MFKRIFVLTPVFLAILLSCNALRTQRLKQIEVKLGPHTLLVEVAVTQRERNRGLMFRTSLGENEGMLFVFPRPARTLSFWMKNTLIPLDVGYFDDQGFLIEVVPMAPEPGKADDDLKTYPSSEPAVYALEMEQGWFKKKGIRKYERLILPYAINGI